MQLSINILSINPHRICLYAIRYTYIVLHHTMGQGVQANKICVTRGYGDTYDLQRI